MFNRIHHCTGAIALIAATSLAMPAHAVSSNPPSADAPHAVSAWSVGDETVHGWGRRHRHRDRIDGGDVLAGILILGGVVAVASAIGNSKQRERERDERYRDYRDYDRESEYRDDRYRLRYAETGRRGIEGAIDHCVDSVERDAAVGSVDTAERDGSGWHVEGELREGGRFSCRIGPDGRVRDIELDIGRRSYGEAANGRSEAYYAEARANHEEQAPERAVEAGEGASPGREWKRGEPDDRYDTADGPDYALVG